MSQHSILAPSSAHRRLRCAASLAVSKNIPNLNSIHSAEGTAYHFIAADALQSENRVCADYVGLRVCVMADGRTVFGGELPDDTGVEFSFVVDEDNAAYAQQYVDAIRRIPGEKRIEVRLDTSEVVGVPGQGGTADCVILDFEHDTIHLVDLKFGRGEVVDAFDNEQLLEYGAAALLKYEMLHDWAFLRIAISQPRLGHFPDMTYAVDKVREWTKHVKPLEQLAYKLWEDPSKVEPQHFTPSEKGCRWCPIRRTCAARTKKQLAEFPVDEPPKAALHLTLAELGLARDRVDAIEAWCKDIKEEAHMRAMRGDAVPGWKLVEGRMGNRKWDPSDAAQTQISEILEGVASDEMYKPREMISASDADKLLNKKKHPNAEARIAAWGQLEPLITRAPPSLSLERASVDKPEVKRSMTEFPLQEPDSCA